MCNYTYIILVVKLDEEDVELEDPEIENLSFWSNFITFLAAIVDEDAKTYSSVLNQ